MSSYELEDQHGNRYRISKGAGPLLPHDENLVSGSALLADNLLASINETSSNETGSKSNGASNSADGPGQGDQFARFQIDAPSCDNCGSITVRNGNCYLCHNCGNSMGCS